VRTPQITCDWCTRPTHKRPLYGRRTYRHQCPHGHWCPRADALRLHDNHYPMGGGCDQCRAAYWPRERQRVASKGAQ